MPVIRRISDILNSAGSWDILQENECGRFVPHDLATPIADPPQADSSARGRAGAIFSPDRRKLHWQPVAALQKDRAGHALEKTSHDTTGTRIGV